MRGLREADWESDPWAEDPPVPRPFLDVVSAPPGLPFNAVVGAAVAVLLVCSATPGSTWGAVLTAVVLLLLGLAWSARLVLHLAARLAGRRPTSVRSFLVAPALVAVTALLLVLHVPVRIGFEVSRPHLDRLADQLLAGELPEGAHPASGPDDPEERIRLGGRRAGLYSLDGATIDRHGVVFDGAGSAASGFARLDADSPPPPWTGGLVDLVALGGGWYAYELTY